MNSYELLIHLQKVIDVGRGHKKIIIISRDEENLEIENALFWKHGITYY